MRATLAGMSPSTLQSWVEERVLGVRVDPPLDLLREETPEDLVVLVFRTTVDLRFRDRLRGAALGALDGVTTRCVAGSREVADLEAARHLAELVRQLSFAEAEDRLLTLANWMLWKREPAPSVEIVETVLFSLARFQPSRVPGTFWQEVWEKADRRLRVVATTGVRRSAPATALRLLPQVVAEGRALPSFPLGEILWAFHNTKDVGGKPLRTKIREFGSEDRAACRSALEGFACTEDEIERIVEPEGVDEVDEILAARLKDPPPRPPPGRPPPPLLGEPAREPETTIGGE